MERKMPAKPSAVAASVMMNELLICIGFLARKYEEELANTHRKCMIDHSGICTVLDYNPIEFNFRLIVEIDMR
jgi:hypothetical protein